MTAHKNFPPELCRVSYRGRGPMNDYIFTCEQSNVTSTIVAFFRKIGVLWVLEGIFNQIGPKKIIKIVLTDVRV